MDPILRRRLASLKYSDPELLLREVLPTIETILLKPDLAKQMPAKERKACLEKYQAAFLAFLMKHSTRSTARVTVAVQEDDDFDCVLKAEIMDGETAYKPVQLKQLPSDEVNTRTDIQTEINKLQKYASPRLSVAFWVTPSSSGHIYTARLYSTSTALPNFLRTSPSDFSSEAAGRRFNLGSTSSSRTSQMPTTPTPSYPASLTACATTRGGGTGQTPPWSNSLTVGCMVTGSITTFCGVTKSTCAPKQTTRFPSRSATRTSSRKKVSSTSRPKPIPGPSHRNRLWRIRRQGEARERHRVRFLDAPAWESNAALPVSEQFLRQLPLQGQARCLWQRQPPQPAKAGPRLRC